MKKIAILPMLALAAAFVACDNVDLGTGIPVVNPELPAAGPDMVSIAKSDLNPAVADLETLAYNVQNVPVATATTGEGWPEGYGFGGTAQVSLSSDFAATATVPVVATGNTLSIAPDELQGAVYGFTHDPADKNLFIRFNLSAVNGKESIVLGGPDTFYGPIEITVKPFAPEEVFENTYYFIYTSDPATWTIANAIEVPYTGAGSVYDNPSFAANINLDAATVGSGLYWKLLPKSAYEANDLTAAFGTDGNGKLDKNPATAQPGTFNIVGIAQISFNLETLDYKVQQAIPGFWAAGTNVNGTSWNNGQFAYILTTTDYNFYYGFANMSNNGGQPEFKFSPTNAWSGDFGVSSDINFNENGGVYSGNGTADGGNNIKLPVEGLYYITLDYGSKALFLSTINTIGMIGDFNGWGASVAMTPSADKLTWTGEVTLSAGQGWKFRMNDGWDINLGGSLDGLTPGGDNIGCTADGVYTVTLTLTAPPTATLVKK